jgi:hypothetical protein
VELGELLLNETIESPFLRQRGKEASCNVKSFTQCPVNRYNTAVNQCNGLEYPSRTSWENVGRNFLMAAAYLLILIRSYT